MSGHEAIVFMARVADQAERYADMVDFLRQMVREKPEDLNVEERNLLSVGFKNQIGGRRSAFRTVSAIQQNKKYEQYSSDCGDYKTKI
jgi:14-3-3 protein epsilon